LSAGVKTSHLGILDHWLRETSALVIRVGLAVSSHFRISYHSRHGWKDRQVGKVPNIVAAKKKPSEGGFSIDPDNRLGRRQWWLCLPPIRHAMTPKPAKPQSSIAHVDGSGTATNVPLTPNEFVREVKTMCSKSAAAPVRSKLPVTWVTTTRKELVVSAVKGQLFLLHLEPGRQATRIQ